MSERTPASKHQPSPRTDESSILEPAVDSRAPRQVHRRQAVGFLAGLAASLPLAASFSWLWPGRRAGKPATFTAATASRPQLMVILPEDSVQQYQLGHALGEYLNYGADEALAPLAAVELSCIAASEIDLPATATGAGPLALLLIAGDWRRLVRFALPDDDVMGHANRSIAERVIDERIVIVGSAVARAVMDDDDRVIGLDPRMLAHARMHEIARRACAGYAIDDWRTDDSGFGYLDGVDDEAKGEPRARALTPDEATHFAPALLALAMRLKGIAYMSLMSTLAEVARRRVVRGEVPGAEWATSGACGTVFENRETRVGYACGMGHVPARSKRFLHFYTLKTDW